METVKTYKVTRVMEDNIFYVTHVIAQSREAAIKESSLVGNLVSCDEIEVAINMKQLIKSLYNGGFCDSQIGVITDLICKSFPFTNWD